MEIRSCLRAQTSQQRENLSDANNLTSGCGDWHLFSCSIPLKARFTTHLQGAAEYKETKRGNELFVLRVPGEGDIFPIFLGR